MNGFLLIEYNQDRNDYLVFSRREDAKNKFIEYAKELAEIYEDPEVLSNDQDDMKELADGGIYSPRGELKLEIVQCYQDMESYDRQKRIETAFCNVGEEDFPEDVIAFLSEDKGDYGDIRFNKDHSKKVVVWQPFEGCVNSALINYIETGCME